MIVKPFKKHPYDCSTNQNTGRDFLVPPKQYISSCIPVNEIQKSKSTAIIRKSIKTINRIPYICLPLDNGALASGAQIAYSIYHWLSLVFPLQRMTQISASTHHLKSIPLCCSRDSPVLFLQAFFLHLENISVNHKNIKTQNNRLSCFLKDQVLY